MGALPGRGILRIFGWKITGTIPPGVRKCVVIAAPHTSWWDYPLGILTRAAINRKIAYLAKKSLFSGLLGPLFRLTGGVPVDRSRSMNMVAHVAGIFKTSDDFCLALAPEGTRRKVDRLKTGFYHIAKAAGVPIIMASLDYGKKQVKFSEPFWPGGNEEEDLRKIWDHFAGVEGKNPALGIG